MGFPRMQSRFEKTESVTVPADREQVERWEAAAAIHGHRSVAAWISETADAVATRRACQENTRQEGTARWPYDGDGERPCSHYRSPHGKGARFLEREELPRPPYRFGDHPRGSTRTVS